MNKRPLALLILSWLLIVKGLLTPVFLFFAGFSEGTLLIEKVSLNVEWTVTLLMGVGLLLAQKWAWWLTTFVILFNALNGFYELMHIRVVLESLGLNSAAIIKYSIKFAGIILLQVLVLVYLFQDHIFVFFDFKTLARIKKMMILIVLNALLIMASYLL